MSSFAHRFGGLLGITSSCLALGAAAGQLKRPITVTDCVRTRRIFEGQVQLSSDGSTVAYVVVAPDIDANKNRYRLYLRDLKHPELKSNGRLLFETERVFRGMKWPAHSENLFALRGLGKDVSIVEVDPQRGQLTNAVNSTDPITSFSADSSGNKIVFVVTPEHSASHSSEAYMEFGYPVLFGKGLNPPLEPNGRKGAMSTIFLARRTADHGFEVSKINDVLNDLADITALSLSPNGRFLTFNYRRRDFPESWRPNPYVQWCLLKGIIPDSLGLYDFDTGSFELVFDAPSAGWGHPVVWADDSQAFSLNALSPVGSTWGKMELNAAPGRPDENWPYAHTHTFAIDLRAKKVTQVAKDPAIWFLNEVVSWKAADSPLLLRKDSRSYEWLRPGEPDWAEIGDSQLSVGAVNIYSAMYTKAAGLNAVSDGRRIVGAFETRADPPEIFVHELSSGQTSVVTDMNPELHDVALVPVETLEWRDRHGFHCSGFLIKPLGYEPGRRYPLVIMTKTWWSQYFLSDTEFHTAFPPQSLADAGFLVLLAQERPEELEQDRSRKFPGHYPGHMSEPAELKNIVDSAVDLLVQKGLADKENVGIMGFSTTSWKTDFFLTHFGSRFRAASSADSGLWNYGLYWSSNDEDLMQTSEEYLGGPPYGKTFANWLQFSPAFNASKIRTPILMEYMARGRQKIDGLEFFVALRRQRRPVELFFYPRGDHVLDLPSERMASLQRNLDWFRFWMQGYEGPSPRYDPEQYARWRDLKQEAFRTSKSSGPE